MPPKQEGYFPLTRKNLICYHITSHHISHKKIFIDKIYIDNTIYDNNCNDYISRSNFVDFNIIFKTNPQNAISAVFSSIGLLRLVNRSTTRTETIIDKEFSVMDELFSYIIKFVPSRPTRTRQVVS